MGDGARTGKVLDVSDVGGEGAGGDGEDPSRRRRRCAGAETRSRGRVLNERTTPSGRDAATPPSVRRGS